MRLFLGLMTPDDVDDALDAVFDAAVRFRAQRAGADRWTPRAERHVTLRFLGETDRFDAVDRAAARAASALRAPRLLVGPFATALTARVVAVPVEGAERAAEVIDEALEGEGLPARDGPFGGHLTVARSRHRVHGREAHEAFAERPLAIPWSPVALQVIESVPAGAPRCIVQSEHPFTGLAG